MEKDFEIELFEEGTEKESNVRLPVNFLSFGEIESDDVKVYIKQDVYKALEKLSASDTSKELGSIVLGDYVQELGKNHVIISEYIEAKYTDASASTLTFTHETWAYVHAEHAKRCPEQKIIGWQHTHPNYGIFLSNYDMFIQENFFNLPFQIAYVIDPIRNLRGFFQWKNGKVEKLKGFYIYDEVGKPIRIEQKKIKEEVPVSGEKQNGTKVLMAVLCAAILILAGVSISLGHKYKEQLQARAEINKELAEQKTEIQRQSETIAQLQERLLQETRDGSGKFTVEELIAMIENKEIVFENEQEVLEELNALKNGAASGKTIGFSAYTVKVGDSLSKICADNQLSYDSVKTIILALNGIRNADEIYVGQTLILPLVGGLQ